jgi:hypothetical protein
MTEMGEIMHRREFIKTIAAAGAMSLMDPRSPLTREAIASPGYFGLHQFIETHPNAVFIKRTNVAYKTDSGAKKLEGLELAAEIFTLQSTPGIPLSHKIAIKPNLTHTYSYEEQTDINTGQGCWILALQDCILNVSSVPLA